MSSPPSYKQPEVYALAARLILNSLGAHTRRTEGRLEDASQCCLVDAVPRPRAPRTILTVETDQPHAMEHVVHLVLWQPSHPCQTFSTSWWCGAWSHREADTRPEAGLFSPKPGVTTLVDDNLSVRG